MFNEKNIIITVFIILKFVYVYANTNTNISTKTYFREDIDDVGFDSHKGILLWFPLQLEFVKQAKHKLLIISDLRIWQTTWYKNTSELHVY